MSRSPETSVAHTFTNYKNVKFIISFSTHMLFRFAQRKTRRGKVFTAETNLLILSIGSNLLVSSAQSISLHV